MYSPKIDPKLIPVLYQAAKRRGVAMTKLVNGFIEKGLAEENVSEHVKESQTPFTLKATETDHPQS